MTTTILRRCVILVRTEMMDLESGDFIPEPDAIYPFAWHLGCFNVVFWWFGSVSLGFELLAPVPGPTKIRKHVLVSNRLTLKLLFCIHLALWLKKDNLGGT